MVVYQELKLQNLIPLIRGPWNMRVGLACERHRLEICYSLLWNLNMFHS